MGICGSKQAKGKKDDSHASPKGGHASTGNASPRDKQPAQNPETNTNLKSNDHGTTSTNQAAVKSSGVDIRQEAIGDVYEFGKEIGRGGFSVVQEATVKTDRTKVAIKRINKGQVEGEDISLLLREVQIMKRLDHPNILKLYEVYENEEEFFLVMELVTGKELFDKIVEKGQYSEIDASNVVRQIVRAVSYLHDNGIAHRDLKPENLLTSTGVTGEEIIKIADFGFSKNFGEEKLKTSCGSPGYVAPEVLTNESYDSSVDMWSLGVIIYILLCGYPPFYAENAPALFKKIMEVKYDFNDPSWDSVSDSAKDLIKHLLVKEPTKRLTAKECLEHAWVLGTSVGNKSLNTQLQELKQYQSKRKLA